MHIVSVKSLLPAALAAVLLLVTLMGAATRPAPQLPATRATTQSAQQSEYIMETGKAPVTLQLSVSIVPKSPGAAVKELFPSTIDVSKVPLIPAEYDAVTLSLGLKTENGETVSLARKVLEIARGGGGAGVQIIKTSLDQGELVVVFGLKCPGITERIGVWHILMRNNKESILNDVQLMTDELTFLNSRWSMHAGSPIEMSDKTIGVQLSRGPAGRWIIELTEIASAQLNEVPAMFVQDPDRWNFVLDRMLGGTRPRPGR